MNMIEYEGFIKESVTLSSTIVYIKNSSKHVLLFNYALLPQDVDRMTNTVD